MTPLSLSPPEVAKVQYTMEVWVVIFEFGKTRLMPSVLPPPANEPAVSSPTIVARWWLWALAAQVEAAEEVIPLT